MADREKVIKGLGICYCPPSKCEECPYHDLPDEQSCNDVLCLDALDLLKEQDDMGKELTDAVELIHKKNARIIELKGLLDQEAVVPIPLSNRRYACGNCGNSLWVSGQRFCASCGRQVKWDA